MRPRSSFALLLALASACTERRALPPEAITIATASPAHTLLIQVAAARGYFAEEGLDVTVKPYSTGKLALEAMLAGEAQLATCADAVVVFATLRGMKVSLVASIASSTRTTAAVVGAAVAAPKDLAGKRVGLPRATIAEFFLDTLLVRHGIAREAVRVVDLPPAALLGALSRREVEAVVVWEPFLSALRRELGDKGKPFFVDDIYFETHDLIARPDLLQQRPEVVEKVLRALVRAEAHHRAQPALANQVVAQGLSLPLADAEDLLTRFDFAVRLDQSLLVVLEEQARWAIRAGLVPDQASPDFRAVIAAGPLLTARPEAVGLIR